MLGFDCEWVTVNANRKPVALLQLAAHSGYCALIRLNRIRGACSTPALPVELRELLADDRICKVGVVPLDDARHLARDYGICVAGTLDLRHLARARGQRPLGLAKMAAEQLGVTMDKDWRVSCSDWECGELNARQVDYAAKDALVAVELFREFVGHRSWPVIGWLRRRTDLEETLSEFEQWLDVPFAVGGGGLGANARKAATERFEQCDSRFKSYNTYIVKTFDPSPFSYSKSTKPMTPQQRRTMSTRAKPLYENCFLQAPDGQLLCTCDRKKAEWYVQKNIGDVIVDDPLTVRLRFEPAGRAVGEVGRYYQLEKENRCAVCGSAESYQRKNIVPREYRKYFPGKNTADN